ncbi:MAG: sensor histidine kinase YesM [Halioglobus sp.]|jgi:sensor histidine kinase YesM
MNILKGISKSDWWVIIGFWILATPIIISDYISHMGVSQSLSSLFLDLILITANSIVLVFWLAPKYLSRRKYIHFFLGLLGALLVESFLYWCGTTIIWGWWVPDSIVEYLGDEITSDGQSLGILGGILLAKKYFEGQQNLLKLEAETKTNELKALQSQVNPHFLFNNLNSLDELIGSNPVEAKKYVNKLAQLYRYLINSKDNDVVTLSEELEFANNYIYLLKQRYGASYKFTILDNMDNKDSILLPPASLQLVLENVVKHNIGNVNNPLETQITIDQDKVSIKNEKRLKSNPNVNNGIGIRNLKARYKLLSDKKIKVEDSIAEYIIELPFINLLNA